MKFLGIDFGSKKIGLAIADQENNLVLPIQILNNQSNNKIIQEIKQICQKEKINKIIIGRPVCLDGKISSQTKRTDFFISQLKKEIKLPIDVADERFTSKIAKQLTGIDDQHSVSAMIILRDYLSRTLPA